MRPVLAVAALLIMALASPATATVDPGPRWSGAWTTSQHHPSPGNEWNGPNWSLEGFADQSVRQVVRVSAGGTLVRIRLSNRYGAEPLRLTGASMAKAGAGAAVRPKTLRPLTFGGRLTTTIPAGAETVSDATFLRVAPLESLTATLYFAGRTGAATFHEGGLTTTYRAAGDHRFDPGAAAFAGETSHSWYYLTGVDVVGGSKGTVVAFGDSITDGAGSTRDANNRYPDELAERLVATGRRLAVDNAGINGNRLLADSPCFGEKGITRFQRDALGQPGVRTAIVLIGINDIGFGGQPDFGCGTSPRVTVDQLITGYRALIRAAHAKGVKIVGATLTPIKGSFYDNPCDENVMCNERLRDGVNDWIRTSGEFDAVVDLDRALADPQDPDALRPAYASPDLLHPNDAGMHAMAAAINPKIL